MRWRKYVPVAARRAKAKRKMDKLRKQGETLEPIEIAGRAIARTFWGKLWCEHLENFSDYDNRLPRGRTYVRNGSVCHLGVEEGSVDALVSGSSLYKVKVSISRLGKAQWEAIKEKSKGQIGSLLELLTGKLSDHVMEIVSDHKEGLFPKEKEMTFSCSCPDWAVMCKHVAAVLYGIGSRLDARPELLFKLRGVDAGELVTTELNTTTTETDDLLADEGLSDLFGIDLDTTPDDEPLAPTKKTKRKKTSAKKAQKKGRAVDPNTITGPQLLQIRLEMKLTVAELAEKLQVTPASVYRWQKQSDTLNLHSRSMQGITQLLAHSGG